MEETRVLKPLTVASKLPSVGTTIFTVMSKLAEQNSALNLGQGFPDFEVPESLREALAKHVAAGRNQYAPMTGVQRLREQIAIKTERLYGHTVDPETDVTVTFGATEALFAAVAATVAAGDEVILIDPCYDSYEPAVDLQGAGAVHVPLRQPDFAYDWDRVRDAISARTRMIIINSPLIKGGRVITAADLDALAEILRNTDIAVVADEVYEHIIFDGIQHESMARHDALASRSFIVGSFGKTYHTTGWKIGYCAAPPALTTEIQRIHQWVTFAVNGAVQMAYADAVRKDPLCRDVTTFYQGRRDHFLSLIRGSRFKPMACRGTFFQMLDYSSITDERDADFALRLTREHGVASIPISPFLNGSEPAGPVLRFCFAKRDATLERAAERLVRV